MLDGLFPCKIHASDEILVQWLALQTFELREQPFSRAKHLPESTTEPIDRHCLASNRGVLDRL